MPLTSFYTALTGLNSCALTINVIGNNLSNMNTTAFKTSQTSFAELLEGSANSASPTGTPIQFGIGSSLSAVTPVLTQGSVVYTGRPLDAAISGNGFFVVSTVDGASGGLGFTRAGNFSFTELGELVNGEGFNVMGYKADNGTIVNDGILTPIVVNKGECIPPRATENVSITANLDSQAADASEFSSAVLVFDTLGTAHVATLTFTKTATGQWSWAATIPATDTGGLSSDPPVAIGNGALVFDDMGTMTSPTTNAILNITGLSSGAADMQVTFNLLDSDGNPLITNYASESTVASTAQDGSASSLLRDVIIDSDGIITGLYDDGQMVPLAQLALADFPNVEGLAKYKGSTLVSFLSSGEPSIGAAGSGGRGSVVGSSLEQSNVDIAQEFVNLIVAQRGYQANSRVIMTTDELYQESLNLIR